MQINRFDPHGDRHAPMLHIVSFHDVPLHRVNAYVLWDCEQHGARVSIASGIRTDDVIAAHNKEFGTDLHGQQFAIDHQGQPGWSAANPLNRTSHCGFSDGSPCYVDVAGHHIQAGGRLPEWEWGIDVDDIGKVEDNSHLLHVAHQIGFHLLAPYSSGSEHHHLVNVRSPIALLEARNVISKDRHS